MLIKRSYLARKLIKNILMCVKYSFINNVRFIIVRFWREHFEKGCPFHKFVLCPIHKYGNTIENLISTVTILNKRLSNIYLIVPE